MYSFSLKQNPVFCFNHTSSTLLADSLRVCYAYYLRKTVSLPIGNTSTRVYLNMRNDWLYELPAYWLKSLRVMYARYAHHTCKRN